jgi:hypothetical protein
MKSVKSILLAVLATFAMASCDLLNVDPSSSFSTDEAYLDFTFLATTADSSNRTHSGKKCNLTEVAIADLPAGITTYINSNYAGFAVKRAGKVESGNYVVLIENATAGTHKGLVFDATGKFLQEREKKGKKGTHVKPEDLPAAITTYITANYTGSSIKGAFKTEDGKYGVMVMKADNSKVMLGFDAALKFTGELEMKEGGKRGKDRKGPKKD